MLRIASYTIHRETIVTAFAIPLDNLKVRLFGIPRMKYRSLRELARNVLRKNIINKRTILAGWGHFRLMWVADTAVAFAGLKQVLPKQALRRIIQHIIDASHRKGYVTAVFSDDRAIDIPYHRGDSLPWLLYMCDKYVDWYKDKTFLKKNKSKIQSLIAAYEKQAIGKDGLIAESMRGDWADTLRRPSSTWNNIMELYVLRFANTYKFALSKIPKNLEKLIIAKRLKGTFLIDHAGSNLPSIDGMILALYLGVFGRALRKRFAQFLQSGTVGRFPSAATTKAFPKKLVSLVSRLVAPGYHTSASWIHLGLMRVNGYKKLGISYKESLTTIESVVERYGNFIEIVNDKGEIFRSGITSEYGFTMSAGQYLEATT
jgi:hypothetical protein